MAPLLFTRFTALLNINVAVLFGIAMQHRMDDLLNIERFGRFTEWEVPLTKTPSSPSSPSHHAQVNSDWY